MLLFPQALRLHPSPVNGRHLLPQEKGKLPVGGMKSMVNDKGKREPNFSQIVNSKFIIQNSLTINH